MLKVSIKVSYQLSIKEIVYLNIMKALVLLGILPFLWQFKGNVFVFQKDILFNALNTQEYGLLSGGYTSPSELNTGIYKLINFYSP